MTIRVVSATKNPGTFARPWEASASRKTELPGSVQARNQKQVPSKEIKEIFLHTQYFLWTCFGRLARLVSIFV